MALTEHERNYAIKEAHNIAASEAYFEVRAGVVNPHPHTIFDAGFSRGWDAAAAPLLEQIAQLKDTVRRHEVALLKAVETLPRVEQLEQQLAEAKRQMESQKDEWLAWDAKRTALEKDSELLDWLENNLFHRDPDDFDLKYGACKDGATTNWQIYAPKGTQGSARVIIRAAIARTQEQG